MQEKHHLQYWHKDQSKPSRRDALIILEKTLSLLSRSLPVALAHIGAYPDEVQESFWRSFLNFDSSTDLTDAAFLIKEKEPDRKVAMGLAIEEWREIVEIRVTTPKGDIE